MASVSGHQPFTSTCGVSVMFFMFCLFSEPDISALCRGCGVTISTCIFGLFKYALAYFIYCDFGKLQFTFTDLKTVVEARTTYVFY